MKEIVALFFSNEWASLSVSVVILLFHLFVESFIDYYGFGFIDDTFIIPGTMIEVPFIFISGLIGLVFGYSGQRIAYKYLGKAEQYLTKKVE